VITRRLQFLDRRLPESYPEIDFGEVGEIGKRGVGPPNSALIVSSGGQIVATSFATRSPLRADQIGRTCQCENMKCDRLGPA
jgi:hypothetical protein